MQMIKSQNMFPVKEKLAVFVTPYEHHSNILPWVEEMRGSKISVLLHDKNYTLIFPQIK